MHGYLRTLRRASGRCAEVLRGIRARFLYSAFDAVHTAPTRPGGERAALLRHALFERSSNFDRVGALAWYLEAVAPSVVAWLRRAIEDTSHMPVRADAVEPLAYGSCTSCMRLPGSPARVLKISRPSLGRDPRTVAAMSREARDLYETLGRWYADLPDLLPHTMHVVLHGPVRGAPAAAQIQDMVPAGGRDLLGGHTDDELVALMLRHPRLRRDLRQFVSDTRRAWDEEGRFLDMVGLHNVLLIPGPEGPVLRVSDFGIWDLELQRRVRPDLHARAVEALDRLERVVDRVDLERGPREAHLEPFQRTPTTV